MTWGILFLLFVVFAMGVVGAVIGYLIRVLGADGHVRTTAQAPARGSGAWVLWIVVFGALAAFASTAMRTTRHVSPPPPRDPMGRMSARSLHDHAALNGVVGGAASGQRALVEAHRPALGTVTFRPGGDPHPPLPGSPVPAVQVRGVRSEAPYASRERALNDALVEARRQLADRLAALDPPIVEVPSVEVVRRDYLRPESVTEVYPTQAIKDEWAAAKLDPNRVWVEIDVEVSDDQLRDLRAKERVVFAGWGLGVGFAGVLALYGFLRLDALTKGYLTPGLGVGAGLLLLAALALLSLIA